MEESDIIYKDGDKYYFNPFGISFVILENGYHIIWSDGDQDFDFIVSKKEISDPENVTPSDIYNLYSQKI